MVKNRWHTVLSRKCEKQYGRKRKADESGVDDETGKS